MTQQQVDEAYKDYQSAQADFEQIDGALTIAYIKVCELEATLEQHKRRTARLWKTYKRFLKAWQI